MRQFATKALLRFNAATRNLIYLVIHMLRIEEDVICRNETLTTSCIRPPMCRLLLLLACAILGSVPEIVTAATSNNAASPLGINLSQMSEYGTEDPLMNIFACTDSWITSNANTWDTGEEADLQLDSNGYPTSLVANPTPAGGQQFTYVQALLQCGAPAGQYTVTYQGEGTMAFRLGATLVSTSPGQYVINLDPSQGSGVLEIVSTDPNHTGDYIRNISVVPSSEESAYASGQTFNPAFIDAIKNFKVLRFMDWLDTNGNQLSAWPDRPQLSDAFYGTSKGVPIELAVKLANAVSADPWLNVPVMADDNYITQMAELVHNELGPTQKVYVELSNEVWNTAFSQYQYAVTEGQATFASGLGSDYDYNRNWYGMRVAQMCDIWKSVWGGDYSRVVCLLGAQAAVTASATEALDTTFWTGTGNGPASAHAINAIAIAPYFGYEGVPVAWTTQSDGGLAMLFEAMTAQNDPSIPTGGFLGETSAWESAYAAVGTTYHLPIIAYEGGQSFVSYTNAALQSLYDAANVDSRMATAYSQYLQSWKANGGQVFVAYNDMGPYNQWGEWGALQSLQQATASPAPPKWQALQSFISGTPCWWSNCVESIASVPQTPANFHAVN
jgi:hypothetical protein